MRAQQQPAFRFCRDDALSRRRLPTQTSGDLAILTHPRVVTLTSAPLLRLLGASLRGTFVQYTLLVGARDHPESDAGNCVVLGGTSQPLACLMIAVVNEVHEGWHLCE